MNYADFAGAFKTATSLPIAYLSWHGHPPSFPYCLLLQIPSDDQYADDRNYLKVANVQLEFYSQLKDSRTQSKIESFFDANDVAYEYQGDTYLDSEQMQMAVYQIQLIKE
ncbi:hypothetical protein [Oenococcus sp.]|uniref:hypothetical protein n=1 Tax=Oenococcus sp. TaxID=1979414 RepID=UPI0039E96A98